MGIGCGKGFITLSIFFSWKITEIFGNGTRVWEGFCYIYLFFLIVK